MVTLSLAEILYTTGEIRFRYSRYLSEDKTKWIRHGMFRQYFKDGKIASEGDYVHGKEHGLWKDYHSNGSKAAEGNYTEGKRTGTWNYFGEDGSPEGEECFD